MIHYQIRKMGADALFQMGDDKKIIDSLDRFIDYYRSDRKTELQPSVKDFIPCQPSPPDSKLHGTENLLHRASMEGNNVVVMELLASGYRNIDAKNQNSQTAVMANHPLSVKILLERGGASPIMRNENIGQVALHEAGSAGHIDCVTWNPRPLPGPGSTRTRPQLILHVLRDTRRSPAVPLLLWMQPAGSGEQQD